MKADKRKDAATRALLKRIRREAPALFRAVARNVDLPALGATDEKPWYETVTDTIKELGPAYLQFETQRKILDAQVDRAKRGLPPLETESIAPTVKAQVGVDKNIMWLGAGVVTLLGIAAYAGSQRRRA